MSGLTGVHRSAAIAVIPRKLCSNKWNWVKSFVFNDLTFNDKDSCKRVWLTLDWCMDAVIATFGALRVASAAHSRLNVARLYRRLGHTLTVHHWRLSGHTVHHRGRHHVSADRVVMVAGHRCDRFVRCGQCLRDGGRRRGRAFAGRRLSDSRFKHPSSGHLTSLGSQEGVRCGTVGWAQVLFIQWERIHLSRVKS